MLFGRAPGGGYVSRAPRGALGAKTAKDEFAFAENPLTEHARGRPGQVEPFHIFHIAAAITDEMVMPHASHVESRGASFDRHFAHQTCLNQIAQIVISRSA